MKKYICNKCGFGYDSIEQVSFCFEVDKLKEWFCFGNIVLNKKYIAKQRTRKLQSVLKSN